MSTGGAASPALAPDADAPAGEGLALAQFAAGCFWSVELVYQRLPGVARTEVGYSQGRRHAPTYRDVCGGGTGHAEVVRVHYDPKECPYAVLLDVFWAKHNPTTLNKQVRDVTTLALIGVIACRPGRRRPWKLLVPISSPVLQGSMNLARVLGADLFSVTCSCLGR